MNDLILFAHPTLGVVGIMAAVWVFVEALNASESNQRRIEIAAWTVAACMVAAYATGGYWYVNFYYAEKAAILKGPWPFAHSIVMETKEHLVIMLLLLVTYLPIAASDNLVGSKDARRLMLWVTGIIAVLALAPRRAREIRRRTLRMPWHYTRRADAGR